ncbi:alpha/beta hydrolase [Hyphomicrobium sp. D-2]|uniref:alpha/beta hydrolase n=1 Tax=Hyphomicrobium sp. D-2 TaxID=3041621 RepID=UPI002458B66B|nr:alpha/beta hydrolase [Hyphomicrobium sp. D-2]MDH4982757.1 alpha/beta hydrolase [Hyphomicrobium sp. D-2]
MTNTAVLIHGAFCGGWCFADMMPVLQQRGWECHAPDLPYHVPGPAQPADPRLAEQSVADYTRDMAAFVKQFPEPPVIFGHSMGGLIAQKLAAQGLAKAIVLLTPAAPWGVLPSTTREMALAKGLMQASPFWNKALNPSFEVAKGDSLASLPPDAQRRVFEMFSPESGKALFELFFWMFDAERATTVETHKVQCPVLVVAGADDLVISPETCRAVSGLYANSTFREEQGRGHFLVMEDGAAELAGRCADWIDASVK